MHVRIVPSQPSLNAVAESSGRMPDCLSGGTGSTPVATATGRGPRRATLARWGGGVRTRGEGRWSPKPVLAGSNPVTPAGVFWKSEHGIAAGASGFQPDDASSTLAARSIYMRALQFRSAGLLRPREEFAHDNAHSSLTKAEFV